MFFWNMVDALILMPVFSAGGYLQLYAEELDKISQLLKELTMYPPCDWAIRATGVLEKQST
jgi:hypothetical protein